ncbi:MAG: Twin-arginine translocation pathway signal sequence domain-containing protein, partial [Betaproteobacteria bacterium]
MNRRDFLRFAAGASVLPGAMLSTAGVAWATVPADARYRDLLVLIELKGGNDGLNTLVPYATPTYYTLRPKLAIARDQVVQLSDTAGLHPALEPLLPLWKSRELAVLQGVGYP